MKMIYKGKFLAAAAATLLFAAAAGGCASEEGSGGGSSAVSGNSQANSSVSENKQGNSSVSGSGMSAPADGKKDRSLEGVMTETLAMYVPFGEDGNYVMVDQDNGNVFTVTMPEEIYDMEGTLIGQEDLEKGNILRIYGNGLMLESYPGQYPGVEKIQVEETGSPSDADQYQEIIDGIYQEPDPSQLPYMNVEYRTSLAVVTAMTATSGYQWEFPDEDGNMQSVIADTAHITDWEFSDSIGLEEPTDLTLWFSKTPGQVSAERWAETDLGAEDVVEKGEKVEVKTGTEDGQFLLEQAEAGYRYLIHAQWENGYVEYGFLTSAS